MIGIALAIILLVCFLLSLILFLIVVCCWYRPGKPITEPTSEKSTRKRSSGSRRRRHSSGGEPHLRHRKHTHRRVHRKERFSDPSPATQGVTYDQFGRQRISIPSGAFEVEIEHEPEQDLELIV